MTRFSYLELFAGAGLVRASLGEGWRCCFANDDDPAKRRAYSLNYGLNEFRLGDVASLAPTDMPSERVDAALLSPPCISLSSAGKRDGMTPSARGSGAIWPALRLIAALAKDGRAPRLVVIENVVEILADRNWPTIVEALANSGYRIGALVIDARAFVPQSRERAFIVAPAGDVPVPPNLLADGHTWHATSEVKRACAILPASLRRAWLEWRLPAPPPRTVTLTDCFDPEAGGWVDMPLAELGSASRRRVEGILEARGRFLGTCFRRTRKDGPQWEARPEGGDGVAGCLRVASGGSSRQSWLRIEDGRIQRRVMTGREAAQLMGLPGAFRLPKNENEALTAIGDGVAVPVVRFLTAHLLEPLLVERG